MEYVNRKDDARNENAVTCTNGKSVHMTNMRMNSKEEVVK
jgi:hypothetical protein